MILKVRYAIGSKVTCKIVTNVMETQTQHVNDVEDGHTS